MEEVPQDSKMRIKHCVNTIRDFFMGVTEKTTSTGNVRKIIIEHEFSPRGRTPDGWFYVTVVPFKGRAKEYFCSERDMEGVMKVLTINECK